MSRRARRACGLALLFALLFASAVVAAFARQPQPKPSTIVAVDKRGHVVRSGATLAPGSLLRITAYGFAARTRVEVVDTARRTITHVDADRSGVATVKFRLPAQGRGAVAMAGAQRAPRRVLPSPARSSRSVAPAPFVVSVPLLRRFEYVVGRRGNGVGAGGVGLGSGTATGIAPPRGSGSLAGTGVDVFDVVVLAALLLAAGTGVVVAARRGRRT